MERMSEPQPERTKERSPEAAYQEVLRDPQIYAHYEGVFKDVLRTLQLHVDDLNFPLSEEQVDLFVICLQQAMDTRRCGDTSEDIAVWVERNLRLIKEANGRRKLRNAQATV